MAWIDDLARTLGEDPLTKEDVNDLLSAARDVAHRVERKVTPLSTFLLGMAVARRTGDGESRRDALRHVAGDLDGILPEETPDVE